MTGSLGMVASTLPVQWLLPVTGWRPLFWALAVLVVVAMVVIAWRVPGWPRAVAAAPGAANTYAAVWRHPYFRRMTPLGFFVYGGLVAMQTLWAGPWMVRVAGYSALQAATGLFWINLSMLGTFWTWGLVNPLLARRGLGTDRLIAWGLPSSFFLMAILIIANKDLGTWTIAVFSLYCMGCSFVSLAQPAVGMAFAPALAGRALTAYNLVIFSGVFVVQWGIGLMIDGFRAAGLAELAAFQAAFGVYLACCVAAYGVFLWAGRDNPASTPP